MNRTVAGLDYGVTWHCCVAAAEQGDDYIGSGHCGCVDECKLDGRKLMNP